MQRSGRFAGMTEEERSELEAMRRSERALKSEVDARDAELRKRTAEVEASRKLLQAHQAERNDLLNENQDLRQQVGERPCDAPAPPKGTAELDCDLVCA